MTTPNPLRIVPITEDEFSRERLPNYFRYPCRQVLYFKAKQGIRAFPGLLPAAFALLVVIQIAHPSEVIGIFMVNIAMVLIIKFFWISKNALLYDTYSKELVSDLTYHRSWDRRAGKRYTSLKDIECINLYFVRGWRRDYFVVTWCVKNGEIQDFWRIEDWKSARTLAESLSKLTGKPLIDTAPK